MSVGEFKVFDSEQEMANQGVGIEPEPVFGDKKNNRGFRRSLPRGLAKVSLEVGWLPLAHNLLKKAAIDNKNQRAKQR